MISVGSTQKGMPVELLATLYKIGRQNSDKYIGLTASDPKSPKPLTSRFVFQKRSFAPNVPNGSYDSAMVSQAKTVLFAALTAGLDESSKRGFKRELGFTSSECTSYGKKLTGRTICQLIAERAKKDKSRELQGKLDDLDKQPVSKPQPQKRPQSTSRVKPKVVAKAPVVKTQQIVTQPPVQKPPIVKPQVPVQKPPIVKPQVPVQKPPIVKPQVPVQKPSEVGEAAKTDKVAKPGPRQDAVGRVSQKIDRLYSFIPMDSAAKKMLTDFVQQHPDDADVLAYLATDEKDTGAQFKALAKMTAKANAAADEHADKAARSYLRGLCAGVTLMYEGVPEPKPQLKSEPSTASKTQAAKPSVPETAAQRKANFAQMLSEVFAPFVEVPEVETEGWVVVKSAVDAKEDAARAATARNVLWTSMYKNDALSYLPKAAELDPKWRNECWEDFRQEMLSRPFERNELSYLYENQAKYRAQGTFRQEANKCLCMLFAQFVTVRHTAEHEQLERDLAGDFLIIQPEDNGDDKIEVNEEDLRALEDGSSLNAARDEYLRDQLNALGKGKPFLIGLETYMKQDGFAEKLGLLDAPKTLAAVKEEDKTGLMRDWDEFSKTVLTRKEFQNQLTAWHDSLNGVTRTGQWEAEATKTFFLRLFISSRAQAENREVKFAEGTPYWALAPQPYMVKEGVKTAWKQQINDFKSTEAFRNSPQKFVFLAELEKKLEALDNLDLDKVKSEGMETLVEDEHQVMNDYVASVLETAVKLAESKPTVTQKDVEDALNLKSLEDQAFAEFLSDYRQEEEELDVFEQA